MSRKPAAQTPVSGDLRDVDRRLLDTLAAHDGSAGICPAVPRLAGLLGVSESSVHRALRRLVAAGLVERVAVFERDDDLEWKRRDRRSSHARRQTSNTYRLTPGSEGLAEIDTPPGVRPFRETPAQTPVPGVEADTPVVEEGSRVSGVGSYYPTEPIEIAVEPPASALLDHDPSAAEVLATLRANFGDVQVLSGPTTYRTARGRVIDLAACSVEDLHRAVDQLDRHTCRRANGGTERCTPERPCGRHARRRRAKG
jgi:DNA-binding Lrp family transcriptional regulator